MTYTKDKTEELILQNNNLIYSLVSKFPYFKDKEDLYQTGVIGLIKASKNYNPNFNIKFSTFAYSFIYGEMYNFVISTRNIKINKDIIRLGKKIKEFIDKHKQVRGYEPSIKSIADILNIKESKFIEVMETTKQTSSIDDELGDKYMFENIQTSNRISNDTLIDLKNNIDSLNDNEKEIIKYRYIDDLTQGEVAKKLKMNQVKVSRLEKKILNKLKEKML